MITYLRIICVMCERVFSYDADDTVISDVLFYRNYSLVPRSSNDSQAHLKFCSAKGACSLLNHVLTQPDSKCLAAV